MSGKIANARLHNTLKGACSFMETSVRTMHFSEKNSRFEVDKIHFEIIIYIDINNPFRNMVFWLPTVAMTTDSVRYSPQSMSDMDRRVHMRADIAPCW